MPYVPPSPSGISFVFGGTSYTPPNGNAIPFVFSQGGIDSVYITGSYAVPLGVTAEGGSPVEGAATAALRLLVAVEGAAPVNGSVTTQIEFSAVAVFAPVGALEIGMPLSVFAYKVPDVTGTAVFAPPFVFTAERSAGAGYNVPLIAFGSGVHGIAGLANVQIRPTFSNVAASGRFGAAEVTIPFAVAGHSSIEVRARLATAMPIQVVAVGRANVRGIAGFTVPLTPLSTGEVRVEGTVQAATPISVVANNANVRQGGVVCPVRFDVSVGGVVGVSGASQFANVLTVAGAGYHPHIAVGSVRGTVVASLKLSAVAHGARGVSASVTAPLSMSCAVFGEHRGFVSGAVSTLAPIRIYARGSRPIEPYEPGIHIKTTTKSLAVFQ